MQVTRIAEELTFGKAQTVEESTVENTKIADVEEKIDHHQEAMTAARADSNLVINSTPLHLCKRQYLLDVGIINETTVTASQFDPHFALYGKISQYLTTFAYFRGNLELTILLRSVPQQYGSLIASWIPYPPSVQIYDDLSEFTANPVLIDISSQQETKYNVPWVSNVPYRNLGEEGIARFTLRPLFFDRTANNVAQDIPFEIWGRYTDFDVMGAKQAEDVPEMQSGAIAASALSTIWQSRQEIKQVAGAVKDVQSLGNTIKQGWNYVMPDSWDVQLDNPEAEGAPVKQSYMGNVSTVGGRDMMQYLGDVEMPAYTNTDLGTSEPYSNALALLQTPGILLNATFGASTSVTFVARPLSTQQQMNYLSFMSRFFRFWRGSMKYSFHFFTSPLISARFRLNVRWTTDQPDPNDAGNMLTEVWSVRGTTHHSITLPYIHKAPWQLTDASVDVPIVTLDMTQAPAPIGNRTPHVYCVAMISAGPDFQFSSMQDFANGQISPIPELQCDIAEFHKEDFPMLGEGRRVTNYAYNPPHYSVMALQQRYGARGGQTFSEVGPNTPLDKIKLYQSPNFDILSLLFRFHRGSIRVKAPFFTENDLGFLEMENYSVASPTRQAYTLGGGGSWFSKSIWPLVEVSLPYLNNAMASFTAPPVNGVEFFPSVPVKSEGIQSEYSNIARGADYMMYYLMPIPGSLLWVIPPTP